jgi:hypothetical protein
MKLTDFLSESLNLYEAAPVGREYQHLEDLMIVNGSAGALEALRELRSIEADPSSLNIKWDGSAALYWGRDATGNFLLAPKAQWEKGAKLSKPALEKEIMSTGRMKAGETPEQFAAKRKDLAGMWLKLHDEFERATPRDFRGYLWADLMFSHAPMTNKQGNYEFKPNKVDYFIAPHSYLGERIKDGAEIMVAVHGKFKKFGSPANAMAHASDAEIAKFNDLNKRVITLPIQRPTTPVESSNNIMKLIMLIKKNTAAIDEIANFTAMKFSGWKKVMYDYAVKRAQSHGTLSFKDWLNNSKLSDNQKNLIKTQIMPKKSFQIFWKVFDAIQKSKEFTLDKLHKSHGAEQHNKLGLSMATNSQHGGEGFAKVTAAGNAIKLINPHFRSAETAERFK